MVEERRKDDNDPGTVCRVVANKEDEGGANPCTQNNDSFDKRRVVQHKIQDDTAAAS